MTAMKVTAQKIIVSSLRILLLFLLCVFRVSPVMLISSSTLYPLSCLSPSSTPHMMQLCMYDMRRGSRTGMKTALKLSLSRRPLVCIGCPFLLLLLVSFYIFRIAEGPAEQPFSEDIAEQA
mmetsp:Transcript_15762/g.36059  ORF Transcript_15762/g.36059 Transcript_15762/m.36059 type:complete len:121 (-) Transcript_15762:35-397(-)